jgi:hypothetical protein
MDKGTDAVDVSLYDFQSVCLVPLHIICVRFSLLALCNVLCFNKDMEHEITNV